jgi:hypothetical protein
MHKFTKRIVVIGVAVTVGVGSAVAWASWSARGSGSARAKAGRALQVTTVGTTQTGSLLYPGADGDLVVNVKNDNDFRIVVNSVVPMTPIAADAAHKSHGCVDGATGVVGHFVTVSWPVPAHQTAEFIAEEVVHMNNSSDTGCQGAKFTVPVVLIATSG